MKKSILLLMLWIPAGSYSQQIIKEHLIINQEMNSEKNIFPVKSVFASVDFTKTECLPDMQKFQMKEENKRNREAIIKKDPDAFKNLKKLTLFITPYRSKAGFSDYGFHTLNFQVDHNETPNGQLTDYFCGKRTYDWNNGNHAGTDYILWPYPWKRMEENLMEIVAAAPGIIINKRNNFNDHNCSNGGNPNWNGIVVEHSDGSTATYMHFKKNSATTKEIGETVEAGEYLGLAGSSGSSNIPHLHFEIADNNGNLIDPYKGDCNPTTEQSWWQEQENYYVPRINRISTHYVATQDSECPKIENTYEKVNFNSGDALFLKLYYRDINIGDVTQFKIYKPDGTLFSSWNWTQDWGTFYATAYGYWTMNITNDWPQGVYTIEVVFGGNTYNTIFGVGTNLAVEDFASDDIRIYPNPVKDILYIDNFKNIQSAEILDSSGRMVVNNMRSGQINVSNLAKGMYLLKIKNIRNEVKIVKFIKY